MASLIESFLNVFTDNTKTDDQKALSRSEREAKIKDKAGMVINVFALLLAINTWYGGKLSSTVMNDTIAANDIYGFYQAKAIKSTQYEIAADESTDKALKAKYLEKVERYESDPVTGEGKRELLAKAKKLEAERDAAKVRSPWIGYASIAFQLAIVILSASILAVSMELFWGSFVVAGLGIVLASQGLFLWL